MLGLAALLVVGVVRIDCRPQVRVATFNIRMFPEASTDPQRVAETIAELDADIFGVQEIVDPFALGAVLEGASNATDRDYRFALSRCRDTGYGVHPGLVWDARRWHLESVRDYPELEPDRGQACGSWQPGLLGIFRDDADRRIGVLSVHLPPFPDNYPTRRKYLARALAIQSAVHEELGITVLTVGDFNTTGFSGKPPEERELVRDLVDAAGFTLLTGDLACTEYYRPNGVGPYLPSLLDHIVASDGQWKDARALGLCERLRCEVTDPEDMEADFFSVSDHCPTVVVGRPAD